MGNEKVSPLPDCFAFIHPRGCSSTARVVYRYTLEVVENPRLQRMKERLSVFFIQNSLTQRIGTSHSQRLVTGAYRKSHD